MSVMTHDEAFAELESVALDTASAEVADAVRAHAATCPECGPELAALEQAVATLGTLVPAAEINRGRSAGIRSRIIMRARSERQSRSAPVPGPPDLARGVASLRGQGQRVTPGAQRQVTGETKKVIGPLEPLRKADVRSGWRYAIAATLALVATGAQLLRVTSERDRMRSEMATTARVTPAVTPDTLKSTLSRKDSMIAAM